MNREQILNYATGNRRQQKAMFFGYHIEDGKVIIDYACAPDSNPQGVSYCDNPPTPPAPQQQIDKALNEYIDKNGIVPFNIYLMYGVDKRAKQTFASCEADVDMTPWKPTN